VSDAYERERERLREVAAGFEYGVARRSEGRILSLGDGVAHVSGLRDVRLRELVEIEGGGDGLALDLRPDDVGVVLLDAAPDVRVGKTVRGTGRVASVPVGEGLLGRVVDPLGNPLDGGAPPETEAFQPVERPAPGIVHREPVTEPLLTGLTVVDALFPIGRGQRQLVIGDRGTGKTTIPADTIVNQAGTGVRCVYVVIGQRAASVMRLLETLRRTNALAHTVVVVAEAGAPPGLRFLAPYAGCTMAEYFRDRGEDAFVVYDDLGRHAIAYRELSLLLRRPPGREAYPGDIFFLHARLLERATRLTSERGGGSLTAMPITETQAGRISDYIPTNLISITDGQLYLDPQLFDRGIKPAIDVGLSVSRVGGKTQRPAMKDAAGRLRLDITRYREVEVFSRFGGRLEESTRQLLVRGARALEVLKQPPSRPIPLGEQVALLLALEQGLFDPLPVDDVGDAAAKLRERLRRDEADLLRSFETGHPVADEDREAVRRAFPAAEQADG
jgi:F-type H+-transporting ATPase subunit alpha